MKHGYSILLGESLQAERIEYHDCEHYQVVCPACREPVFKGVRQAGVDVPTHYLSHYGGEGSHAECELRMAHALEAGFEEQNKVAREQRLAYFLKVLRRTVEALPLYKEMQKLEKKVHTSAGVRMLRQYVLNSMALNDAGSIFDSSVTGYLLRLEHANWKVNTTFAQHVQRRIARDMWLTVMTPAGRPNFDLLFNHAFAATWVSWEKGQAQTADPADRRLLGAMRQLLDVREKHANRLIFELQEAVLPDHFNQRLDGQPDSHRSTMLLRIIGSSLEEMAGTLLTLPYFELLKERFGDPSKVYPTPPMGAVPVDAAEREHVRQFNRQMGFGAS